MCKGQFDSPTRYFKRHDSHTFLLYKKTTVTKTVTKFWASTSTGNQMQETIASSEKREHGSHNTINCIYTSQYRNDLFPAHWTTCHLKVFEQTLKSPRRSHNCKNM